MNTLVEDPRGEDEKTVPLSKISSSLTSGIGTSLMVKFLGCGY